MNYNKGQLFFVLSESKVPNNFGVFELVIG
jgi:hypothetical protein